MSSLANGTGIIETIGYNIHIIIAIIMNHLTMLNFRSVQKFHTLTITLQYNHHRGACK